MDKLSAPVPEASSPCRNPLGNFPIRKRSGLPETSVPPAWKLHKQVDVFEDSSMASPETSADAMLSLNPADCENRDVYKLMTGIIVPRPVALVSTVDRNGAANLAPFSFFTGVGSNPPTWVLNSVPWCAQPQQRRKR